ncbi:MAG: MATE family efflux transporter [Leptospiraceae bacterium]|nr:MATE family efflux transporter [Leptospiraceae bacterium]
MSLTGDRINRIHTLSLPIMGAMVSQNILNLVDTAMVGRLPDAAPALAAVNLGGFANFWAISLILGLSVGVQAMASRRVGEGRMDVAAVPLNGGVLLALVTAIPLSLILFFITPFVYHFLENDPAVIEAGVPYLQARLLAGAAMAVNYCFRGFWNGTNRPHVYMLTLFSMHALNIFLNYVLIFGHLGAPALGTAGAGIASAISVVGGSLMYTGIALRTVRSAGFLTIRPDATILKQLIRTSTPSGIQQFFFAAGLLTLSVIIGVVGTEELAGASVMINIMLTAYLPGLGLGLGAATLVGQALGRGHPEDAKEWGYDTMKVGMIWLGALGLPMILIPDVLIELLAPGAPEVLELARLPLQIMGAGMFLEGIGLVLMNALNGAGDSRSVMIVSGGLQWLLFLPLAAVVGPWLGYGLLGIWIVNGISRALMAFTFLFIWKRGLWSHVQV